MQGASAKNALNKIDPAILSLADSSKESGVTAALTPQDQDGVGNKTSEEGPATAETETQPPSSLTIIRISDGSKNSRCSI